MKDKYFTRIRIFVKVYELRNMSKSAIKLNVSQSTISESIYHLENELDTILFIRKGRNGLVPTHSSLILYHTCLSILQAWDKGITTIQEISKSEL